jgi:hypothetical protein
LAGGKRRLLLAGEGVERARGSPEASEIRTSPGCGGPRLSAWEADTVWLARLDRRGLISQSRQPSPAVAKDMRTA